MNKTIGILAHVDAGKTTLAEQILYHTKSIRNRGRVDHKNTLLDNHNIEKDRGITIFSDQALFNYNDSAYFLIDTPGHIDFSPEMERAINAMDYGIIVLSGVEGVQGHTETVWQLLRKYNKPTIFFINKVDRTSANTERVLDEIKTNLTKDAIFISKEFAKKPLNEEVIEFIAERDEKLLELYLNGDFEEALWIDSLKKMIMENKIFPCFCGSALQDIGIEEFIYALDKLTHTQYNENDEFGGQVYKIRYDEQGNRVTYIKALTGKLKVRDEVKVNEATERYTEKITQIRLYNGNKFKAVDNISAGEVFGVIGLNEAKVGDGIGNYFEEVNYEMIPTLKSKVIFDKSLNIKDVLNNFRILEAEDPSLNVEWNDKLQEIQVNIMGVIQLEVLKQLLEERFRLNVEFGPCEILYKETILTEGIGYGHFEPLKHYAEVHLKLESAERNSGIIFENQCHADDMTIGHQNLVRTHIFEREHHGILTGSPLTDVKIILLTGRAHNKHTSGGDFREATYRALRQGLESCKNALIEPFYRYKIEAHIDNMGRLLSDIEKLNGSFQTPEINNEKVIIIGRGPVATFMNYGTDFVAITKGKGKLNFIFDGYDICHNENEVIEKIGYNRNADIEYTSTSVFCSKGQSFLVDGSEAKDYMHCLK
ncbi:elongation factor G [Clostridium paridis]|uniref:TetM/TetW/TetO/TetS family tetracycline resistance ribosomal protection protein n=1 Tax=Clostridium paridis TaxID=2803863 RepID=A0A937FHN5_9CLOT|nr:TetM/TetW/TetO/TetS family tetracycline resistance ribosomal protection protein [Clostridium paridis]MBL4931711.1 TetM/TetW/TetO/TetS family tetracycline resistance ribosomal protection protein [Clostridium paridis]